MEIRWFRFFNRDTRYRNGTARERRMIELKVSAAFAVKNLRISRELTQQELAELLGVSQARVSKLEQIQVGVSLELYVEALLVLGASDAEIARALNAGECFPVKKLRAHAAKPYYPRPRAETTISVGAIRP